MADSKSINFVNTPMDSETYEMLIAMAKEDGFEFSRSAFVRKLIRQEWTRRYSQPNPEIPVDTVRRAVEVDIAKEHRRGRGR